MISLHHLPAWSRKSLGYILVCFLVTRPQLASAQTITLVDFGSSKPASTFGLAGWTTLLLSPLMTFSADGPDGVLLGSNFEEFTDYLGIRGTARNFIPGERIVVTWYNCSDQSFVFSARISFDDSDQPSGGTSNGSWFTMRSFDDYRNTYQTIAPHSSARTAFNITDHGVHKSDGTHSLVNINLHIEWFETWPKQYILCDKIELMTDADILAPAAPNGLTSQAVSDSKVELQWQKPADNVEAVEYLIYLNGEVEGYSRENHFTAVFLEPGRSYTFAVAALDRCRNESVESTPVTCATLPYQQATGLINPAALEYRGAFRLPPDFDWGGEATAFCADGDGGASGSGSVDGYSGSLFVTNLNQGQAGFVGEVSIPAPVIAAAGDPDLLPEARMTRVPVNIRPTNINGWGDYVDIWRTGLTYVEEEKRLYSVWSVHYTVTGEKHACLSACSAANLTGAKLGAWYVGAQSEPPIDAMLGDYLFTLPNGWAAEHTSGRSLVTGRYRDGGLSGLGPTLYAVAPVGTNPPPVNAVLAKTTLLEYGPVSASDYYHFPNAIDGYLLSDNWKDAAWIEAGDHRSVVILGNKARGDNWYGYMGEHMPHDWVIADVPYPEFYETDPDGKGWKSHNWIPMAIFFDPDQLALVAQGALPSHQPQPYAAKRFSPDIFFGAAREIRTASYDAGHHRLYAFEFVAERDGLSIAHVWDVKESAAEVAATPASWPRRFGLQQNYPNPSNAATKVSYFLPGDDEVVLEIFDLAGRRLGRILQERESAGWHERRLDLSSLPSGVFVLRLRAGELKDEKKIVVVK